MDPLFNFSILWTWQLKRNRPNFYIDIKLQIVLNEQFYAGRIFLELPWFVWHQFLVSIIIRTIKKKSTRFLYFGLEFDWKNSGKHSWVATLSLTLFFPCPPIPCSVTQRLFGEDTCFKWTHRKYLCCLFIIWPCIWLAEMWSRFKKKKKKECCPQTEQLHCDNIYWKAEGIQFIVIFLPLSLAIVR